MAIIRATTLLVIGILPASKLKNVLLRMCGMKIALSAKIHPQIVWGSCRISVGANSLIRPFNVIRNVKLQIGANAIIGSWNWFSAAPSLSGLDSFKGLLALGNHSSINSRHYFDCSGGIEIGDFSGIAGIRSTFLTHFVDTKESVQKCRTISVGNYVSVSSNVCLAPGATIGNQCLIGMGSVLTFKTYPDNSFIAGVPGIVKSEISGEFFSRKIGNVAITKANFFENN